jgi:inosine-uridine nucleoside N-ribohydrolase
MVAILLALAADDIELLGVTTVAGNQTVEKTTLNALRVATMAGARDLKIAKGCGKPLVRDLHTAPEMHGQSGLDGADLPEPVVALQPEHGVDFLEHTIMSTDRPITLIPIGPLTNIAMLLLKAPSVADRIEKIVLMGGSVLESNVTPVAEFNIFVDPEAAEIVFTSGLPVTMVGLDVTYRALFTEEDFVRLEKGRGRISSLLASLLRYYARANESKRGIQGAPLHDALAVAVARDPGIAETKRYNVMVETQGILTRGQTVVDTRGTTGNPRNIDVVVDFDLQRFKHAVLSAIEFFDTLPDGSLINR